MASQPEGGNVVREEEDGTEEPDRKRARISADDEIVRGPYADIDLLSPGTTTQKNEKLPVNHSGLSWRQDPEQSFSDWTIIIDDENGTLTTYHVHRSVLGAGHSHSDYFSTVFRSKLAETRDSTSRISLPPLAASAFPAMLDYMYGNSSSPPNNSTPHDVGGEDDNGDDNRRNENSNVQDDNDNGNDDDSDGEEDDSDDSDEEEEDGSEDGSEKGNHYSYNIPAAYVDSVFTVKTAVPLRHLAQYFGIQNLFMDATHFIWEYEATDWQVPVDFLKEAAAFDDDVVISRVCESMASALKSCDECSLLATLSPPLLLKVFDSPKLNGQCSSAAIADLCKHCDEANKLDWVTFKALTSSRVVSRIGPEECLYLLQRCFALKTAARHLSDYDAWKDISSRCADACVRYRKECLVAPLRSRHGSQHRSQLEHEKLPPKIQISILEEALCRAEMEVTSYRELLGSFHRIPLRYEHFVSPAGLVARRPTTLSLSASTTSEAYLYHDFPVYFRNDPIRRR